MKKRLNRAAAQIASNYDKPASTPFQAWRKLFVAPRWIAPGVRAERRWKRGELVEWLTADSSTERREEWGDVGYYIAQSWSWLWWLYKLITPARIIESAVCKFERRAQSQRG